jgi:hypothetical protein
MTLFQAPLGIADCTHTILTANTATVVLAADGQNSQVVAKVRICNVHSAAVVVDLEVYNGTTSYFLISGYSLAEATLPLEINDIFLAKDESLRVTSDNAGGLLHVEVLSALPRRAGG